jgi:hypothetical protein
LQSCAHIRSLNLSKHTSRDKSVCKQGSFPSINPRSCSTLSMCHWRTYGRCGQLDKCILYFPCTGSCCRVPDARMADVRIFHQHFRHRATYCICVSRILHPKYFLFPLSTCRPPFRKCAPSISRSQKYMQNIRRRNASLVDRQGTCTRR